MNICVIGKYVDFQTGNFTFIITMVSLFFLILVFKLP
jgi:hypothetical protein